MTLGTDGLKIDKASAKPSNTAVPPRSSRPVKERREATVFEGKHLSRLKVKSNLFNTRTLHVRLLHLPPYVLR